ncbi:MAG: AAA family ATPase [Acidimicrobiia bacterium]|nr:AAA family ATPase [Acidimicrobiia bacterium]
MFRRGHQAQNGFDRRVRDLTLTLMLCGMRFTIRNGSDPVARADPTLIKALGLPYGGVVSVGNTHTLIKGGDVSDPTGLEMGETTLVNSGLRIGSSVEVTRAVLPTTSFVHIRGEELPVEPIILARTLHGRPVTSGDRIAFRHDGQEIEIVIDQVVPNGAGLVGASTRFGTDANPQPEATETDGETIEQPVARTKPEGETATAEADEKTDAGTEEDEESFVDAPTPEDAILAGLESETDLLAGWISLLTSPRDLPSAWGLPQVAGVLLEGPNGGGKSELVAASAKIADASVTEIPVDQVFKPDSLLEKLEKAIRETNAPGVIFVDRLETVAGEEGLAPYRTQVAAVLRWFLDSVAEKPGLACVLGVTSLGHLETGLVRNELLPRSLSIPPPDTDRRQLLFEAALARVPHKDVDYHLLASRSAGFSAADVIAAVLHASTRIARSNADLGTADIMAAVEETTPSLGSVSLGEMPSHGFDQVANLTEVKQRLTEAVIWPTTEPGRFATLGIEPPRGILLYGPPGTGKTFVVRALAHEAGAAFFSVKGAELLDKYVGESERGVREVFSRARAAAPSIIFFDEFDALAPIRGNSNNSVTDSVVAALLTEIDGVGARGDVAVIGATNRPDLIDPALLRAGRFEIQIELGLPEESARRALLDISDVPFADDVNLDELAAETEGLSFADITGMLREAALNALRRDTSATIVTSTDIEKALKGRRL